MSDENNGTPLNVAGMNVENVINNTPLDGAAAGPVPQTGRLYIPIPPGVNPGPAGPVPPDVEKFLVKPEPDAAFAAEDRANSGDARLSVDIPRGQTEGPSYDPNKKGRPNTVDPADVAGPDTSRAGTNNGNAINLNEPDTSRTGTNNGNPLNAANNGIQPAAETGVGSFLGNIPGVGSIVSAMGAPPQVDAVPDVPEGILVNGRKPARRVEQSEAVNNAFDAAFNAGVAGGNAPPYSGPPAWAEGATIGMAATQQSVTSSGAAQETDRMAALVRSEGEVLSRSGVTASQEPAQTGALAPQTGRNVAQAATKGAER